jgi:hypothetical protein
MQSIPQTASTSLASISDDALLDDRLLHARQKEDRIYQAVTVAAILLVLASLWIF